MDQHRWFLPQRCTRVDCTAQRLPVTSRPGASDPVCQSLLLLTTPAAPQIVLPENAENPIDPKLTVLLPRRLF
jgi:hypothetical protein